MLPTCSEMAGCANQYSACVLELAYPWQHQWKEHPAMLSGMQMGNKAFSKQNYYSKVEETKMLLIFHKFSISHHF